MQRPCEQSHGAAPASAATGGRQHTLQMLGSLLSIVIPVVEQYDAGKAGSAVLPQHAYACPPLQPEGTGAQPPQGKLG